MKNPEKSISWGSTRIYYVIMTDYEGQQWKVPTHINGEPVEYLRKHDPNEHIGTYDRLTVDNPPTT